jgi:hypothetical protein
MRRRNIASARLVSMLGQMHMSASAVCYCDVQHYTKTYHVRVQQRALPGACRVALLVACWLAPRRRQQECDTYTHRAMQIVPCIIHATQRIGRTAFRSVTNVSLEYAWRRLQRPALPIIVVRRR